MLHLGIGFLAKIYGAVFTMLHTLRRLKTVHFTLIYKRVSFLFITTIYNLITELPDIQKKKAFMVLSNAEFSPLWISTAETGSCQRLLTKVSPYLLHGAESLR